MEKFKVITDMDGTLYSFGDGAKGFSSSRFGQAVRSGSISFVMNKLALSEETAIIEYERIKSAYNGHFSIGIEKEHGIDRFEFFRGAWNLDASTYIEADPELGTTLEILRGRVALLTAAPRVWANNVLAHLKIADLFGEHVYTGEPDVRKPNPQVFVDIARNLGVSEDHVFSIGDQEESDILPAKAVGMRTILIGDALTSSADYQVLDIKAAVKLLTTEGFI